MRIMLVGVVLGTASSADAQGSYFSRNQILKDFFSSSKKVTFEKIATQPHGDALRGILGYVPQRASYTLFIGKTGDRVDGYAIIDDEPGQHLPITFAILLGPDGTVRRSEVMVYREGYGHEIREQRFRDQFVGKGSHDDLRLGQDVVAISGATLSSRSMARAIRRAVALVRVTRLTPTGSAGKGAAQ